MLLKEEERAEYLPCLCNFKNFDGHMPKLYKLLYYLGTGGLLGILEQANLWATGQLNAAGNKVKSKPPNMGYRAQTKVATERVFQSTFQELKHLQWPPELTKSYASGHAIQIGQKKPHYICQKHMSKLYKLLYYLGTSGLLEILEEANLWATKSSRE